MGAHYYAWVSCGGCGGLCVYGGVLPFYSFVIIIVVFLYYRGVHEQKTALKTPTCFAYQSISQDSSSST